MVEAKILAIQLTMRCNISCSHCCQSNKTGDLPVELAEELILKFYKHAKLNQVNFAGGEVFLRFKDLRDLIQLCGDLDMVSTVQTNASWCTSRIFAKKRLQQLKDSGLTTIGVSWDSFHAKDVNKERIINLIKAAEELDLKCHLNSINSVETFFTTRAMVQRILEKQKYVSFNEAWFLPVGEAKHLEHTTHMKKFVDIQSNCRLQNICTITPDGSALPCCSAGTHPNLAFGNFNYMSFSEILRKRTKSKFLKTLLTQGPKGLVNRLPDPLRNKFMEGCYSGVCHLCYEVMNCKEAVEEIKRPQEVLETT